MANIIGSVIGINDSTDMVQVSGLEVGPAGFASILGGITPEGGFYIQVVAGETLTRGQVVMMSATTDGRVVKNAIDGDMPIGVVYADAASAAAVKIVVSGIAYVLPDTGITAARGNVIYSSSTAAGLVQQASSVPVAATHFREIGHWLDTGSGNGAICRAVIHFN